ncbi:uncharacterized protein LOC109793805 [Cajanus cajan]|uniref:uncharacterized protein LOC109793805 n=1 Tax=Cajanus cajan TaxID=3821 RepID=UPI00098D8638|nr:uncharacterized protein LOC109793805 [Cajanus cajan]
MIAWLVELSEFGIKYESHGPLKAQCLADFVAELTPTSADEQQVWTLHVDGSSNSKGGGVGIILVGPSHVTLEQSLKFGFKVTNNQAEYEALLARLRLAHDLGAWRISSFEEFTIHHVPREQNARADLLSKLASTKCPEQHWTIIQETLHSPSLDDKVVNTSDSGDQGWMTGIWNYLKEGALPEDKDEAWKMRVRSAKFFIVRDELFKRGISTPLLKCLAKPQATYVVEEIHRGICGMHSRARSMVTSVLQAGYYWPTMKSDCQAYVQKCKECQQFGNAHRQPLEALHQMMSLWPFAQWRMDILGPFPLRKGFGIPHSLVTDNGRQFIPQSFEDFLHEIGVKQVPTSVEHPQTNGQAEAANKVILRELKKWLGSAKGQWVDELPSILWAYHCTPQ